MPYLIILNLKHWLIIPQNRMINRYPNSKDKKINILGGINASLILYAPFWSFDFLIRGTKHRIRTNMN